MSKVNFGVKFTTGSSAKRSGMKFKGKITYDSREEAIYNNNDFFNTGYLTRDNAVENNQHYFNYFKKDNPVVYYSNGSIVRKEDEKIIKYNEKLLDNVQNKDSSCLYQTFISFQYDFSKDNIDNKYSEEEFYEKLKPSINNFLIENGFALENTTYFTTVHTNKDHFHVHFDFIENKPMRTKNKLDIKKIQNMRKDVMLSFDPNINLEYKRNNEKLWELKKQLRDEMEEMIMLELNNQLLKETLDLYEKTPVRFMGDIKDEKLVEKIKEIRSDIIIGNDSMNEFSTHLDKQNEFNKELYGDSSRNQKDNQLDEIYHRMDNAILKVIKNEMKLKSTNETMNILFEITKNQYLRSDKTEAKERIANKLKINNEDELIQEVFKLNFSKNNNSIIEEELKELGLNRLRKYQYKSINELPKSITINDKKNIIKSYECQLYNTSNKQKYSSNDIKNISRNINYATKQMQYTANRRKYELNQKENEFWNTINSNHTTQ